MTSTISAGWTRVSSARVARRGTTNSTAPERRELFQAAAHGAQPIGPLGMPRSGEVSLAGRVHLDDDGESGHRP